jgi:hypothetical protein
MAIADGKGHRPDMCTRFITGPDSTRSCGGQTADPENALVAFDYLSGSQGGQLLSVEGVVDSRVSSVRAWLEDGTEVRPRLVGLGVDRLRGFAVLTKQGEPHALRLAAYASDGKALEYVNVAARLGVEWGPVRRMSACPADTECPIEDFDADLIAMVVREQDRIVVYVWPEVSEFEVSGPSALNHHEFSGDDPSLLIRAFVVTPANLGGRLDGQLTVTAVAGANSVEKKVPAP